MCYIVCINHSLHWRYIKIALQEYVIRNFRHLKRFDMLKNILETLSFASCVKTFPRVLNSIDHAWLLSIVILV